MADQKISELTNLTGASVADDDELVIVDTSATETKAITFGEFKTALDTTTGFVRITGDTMTGSLVLSGDPSVNLGAATKQYVDTELAALVDSAPTTLDTLNELAAALGDDPSFATTVTNSIATKLPLSGGTMTGDITFNSTQLFDGRDVSADGSKLDGIEVGATSDQTAQEIATAIDADATAEATLKSALGLGTAAYTASTDYATAAQGTNADTAFGWGDHSAVGYLTSYTETDPIYTASSWYTTTNNSSNWDAAYAWGDHAAAGYGTTDEALALAIALG